MRDRIGFLVLVTLLAGCMAPESPLVRPRLNGSPEVKTSPAPTGSPSPTPAVTASPPASLPVLPAPSPSIVPIAKPDAVRLTINGEVVPLVLATWRLRQNARQITLAAIGPEGGGRFYLTMEAKSAFVRGFRADAIARLTITMLEPVEDGTPKSWSSDQTAETMPSLAERVTLTGTERLEGAIEGPCYGLPESLEKGTFRLEFLTDFPEVDENLEPK